MALSEAKSKANQKFDKKAYDTLGIKTKKGVKNMLEIIANNYDMNKSTLVKNAISDYVEKLVGSNIIKDSLNDFEMIIKYVLPPSISYNKAYIYEHNFHYLLDLRNRAEKNYDGKVISEDELISKFVDGDGNNIILKNLNKLTRKVTNVDKYFSADKNIYDILYLLVYQAHI